MATVVDEDQKRTGAANGGRAAVIMLADVPEFRLGSVRVLPGTRRVEDERGRGELLEPRVMQVLVALHRAGGATVSREELSARCWAGRVVGENALQQAISRLREVAAGVGGGSFRVETVPKVGYRLLEEDAAADRESGSVPGRSRRAALAVLGGFLLLAAGSWFLPREGGPTPQIVSIESSGVAGGQELAWDLAADLGQLAAGRPGLRLLAAGREQADWQLWIEPSGASVTASLLAADRGEVLWSDRILERGEDAAGFREQLAARSGIALLCLERARTLEFPALRFYVQACILEQGTANDQRLRLLRQVTTMAPAFAQGWAERALVEAELAEQPYPMPLNAAQRELRRAAHEHLAQARVLEPRVGTAFAAEAQLLPPDAWERRAAVLERGIEAAPEEPRLHALLARVHEATGRMNDAVSAIRRAVDLSPLSPRYRAALVSALAYADRFDEAARELAVLERMWLDAEATREVRYRFHLRYGDPAVAGRMIEEGEVQDFVLTGRAFLEARVDPSEANVEPLLAFGETLSARGYFISIPYLQALATFDRVDEAYALLERENAVAQLRGGSEVLFRPGMASLHHDRRFLMLAARIGLLDHWIRTGDWPDFCGDATLRYTCQVEGPRIASFLRRQGTGAQGGAGS